MSVSIHIYNCGLKLELGQYSIRRIVSIILLLLAVAPC